MKVHEQRERLKETCLIQEQEILGDITVLFPNMSRCQGNCVLLSTPPDSFTIAKQSIQSHPLSSPINIGITAVIRNSL